MPSILASFLLFLCAVAAAEDAVFLPEKLAAMDTTIEQAITEHRLPGGVLWVERRGVAIHHAYGQRALEPAPVAMTEDTIFDAASLTKVIATTPAVMKLIESGKLEIDAPAQRWLPELQGGGKEAITLRHLLTHTSGMRAGIAAVGWEGREAGIKRVCEASLADEVGKVFRYSDLNFILLGEIVRRVSGQTMDVFASEQIFQPLKMSDTLFHPPATLRERIAPTTRMTECGVVHDPTARLLGGVSGNAGLFTTAADLARYARMLLHGGELDGVRVLRAETVKLMTTVQSPANIEARRGLGWDIDTGYSGPRGKLFPLGSYGHTGWTGGSLWIDPFSETFVIFLSNRNHPTESGNVLALRYALGTLAAEAVKDFDFLNVAGALPPSGKTGAK